MILAEDSDLDELDFDGSLSGLENFIEKGLKVARWEPFRLDILKAKECGEAIRIPSLKNTVL